MSPFSLLTSPTSIFSSSLMEEELCASVWGDGGGGGVGCRCDEGRRGWSAHLRREQRRMSLPWLEGGLWPGQVVDAYCVAVS